MQSPFPFHPQQSPNDCGYACLRMVAAHFGMALDFSSEEHRRRLGPAGLDLGQIRDIAAENGLHCMAHWWEWEEFAELKPLPAIVLLRGAHFVVVHAIMEREIGLADPAKGMEWMGVEPFNSMWLAAGKLEGVALTFSRF